MNKKTTSEKTLTTVLIVDDTPANLGVIAENLEACGYRVLVAQDGAEGLQRAEFAQPDLIMLDVMMPRMDGLQVCRLLKKQPSTRDIPVIFMTARSEIEDKVAGFDVGAVDYVTKPLQIEEVIVRIKTHLELSNMRKRMVTQNAQLQRYREQLEQRVAERTRELSDSNQHLRAEIQERKAMAQRLKQSFEFTESVINAIPDLLFEVDANGRYLNVWTQSPELLAAQKEALLGNTINDVLTPEAAETTMAAIREAAENDRSFGKTIRIDHPQGASWFELSVSIRQRRTHADNSFIVLSRDITHRKRSEEQLAIKGAALAQMHEAAYMVDEQARIFYVNAEASRQLGYSRDEFLNMTVMDIAPGWTTEMVVNAWQGLGKGGSSPIEAEHRRKDGSNIPVEISISHLNHDGKAFGLAVVRDITERKRAERELHMLNRALDNSFDATYLVDTDLRVRYVNEAAVRELGYSHEELLSMSLLDIDPSITREMVQELMRQTAAHGRFPGTVESRHRRKNGETFPIEVGATTFSYEGDNLFLTVARNITLRKQTEEVLAVREREFRTLAENLPDFLSRYDKQCRMIYINPLLEAHFGKGLEQVQGKTPLELFPGSIYVEYQARLARTIATGLPEELELKTDTPEGARHILVRFHAEHNDKGEIVGALAIGSDITERKHMEMVLQEREQRYHEIFDNASDGMYLLEVTDDGRFRNIDINPALVKSTGMSLESMIGKFVDETVPAEVGRHIVEKYRRCVAAGTTINESIELDLPAGKNFYQSTIIPIYYDGRVSRLIGISRDITELKRVENDLEASRTQLRGLMARRESAREEERKHIAREVHDELGQVLTGLQLSISVLEHKFAPEMPTIREYLRESRMLTDRALSVARNIASSLRPAALDMGISSALEWLTGRFSANTGIRCNVHIEENEIQLDESHAVALFRIVQESLTNVSRHAKASRIDVSVSKDEDDLYLKICDNGDGFEMSEKRMDSFGLIGIRERALILGGKVVIESSPGNGTQISVRIPINKTAGNT